MAEDAPLEIELKYRLKNWRQVHDLVPKLPAPEAHFTQTNFYLDDANRSLRKAKIMLRAREITFPVGMAKGLGKPPVTITVKRKKAAPKDGLFINEERQQVMHIDDWRPILYGKAQLELKGPALSWLAAEVPGLGPLQILGSSENIRWQIYSYVYMLEIDKTVFSNGDIEAEVECETEIPDDARKHIEALLAQNYIDFEPATQGKYSRFLEKTEGVKDWAD